MAAPDPLSPALDELRRYIQDEVAAGFRSEDEIAHGAQDFIADTYPDLNLQSHVRQITRETIQNHLRQQAAWLLQTDCDRLNAAFAELECRGIVARQDFSCCGNCGSAEIWDEMEETGRRGIDVRGYTFFHMQDTEHAVEGGGLFLAYGASEPGEFSALAIAREIVAALQNQDLAVTWDGTWQTRLFVKMDWKRRR